MKVTLTLLAVAVAALGVGFTRPAARAATVAAPKCPLHAPRPSSGGAPRSHFVRPGAQLVRLCRYSGLNSADPLGLGKQRLIHGHVTIRRMTHRFNRLSVPRRGTYNCPMDDGSALLVVFAYPHVHESVFVSLTGCEVASNGRSARWMTAALRNELLNLVKGS